MSRNHQHIKSARSGLSINWFRNSVLAFLTTISLTVSAAAEAKVNWTQLGYVVVETAHGEFVSRHISRDRAMMSVNIHSYNNGNLGQLAYRLVFPQGHFELVVPDILVTQPPAPPSPPVDTMELLDPNTVYFCPDDNSGAQGTTVEPPGSNNNDGSSPWDAYATLDMLGMRPDGTDVRLCEGGVFEDQRLDLLFGGDIGDTNRIILSQFEDLSAVTLEELNRRGFDHNAIDPVIVGCYKLLNGVPRPCMDTYPRCKQGVATKCFDSDLQKVLPYSRSSS